MKKIMFSAIAAATFLASCSSDDSDKTTTTGGFSNSPVSGVIYDQDFTVGGGTASTVNANGQDMLYIHLGRTTMDCDSDAETPIWIIVPAAVGDYTSEDGATVQFSDDESGSFEGGYNEHIVITSITATTIKGKVIAEGFDEAENSINGTFEVVNCTVE